MKLQRGAEIVEALEERLTATKAKVEEIAPRVDRSGANAPVITHTHITGTGTRFLKANGEQAITELFQRSF